MSGATVIIITGDPDAQPVPPQTGEKTQALEKVRVTSTVELRFPADTPVAEITGMVATVVRDMRALQR